MGLNLINSSTTGTTYCTWDGIKFIACGYQMNTSPTGFVISSHDGINWNLYSPYTETVDIPNTICTSNPVSPTLINNQITTKQTLKFTTPINRPNGLNNISISFTI